MSVETSQVLSELVVRGLYKESKNCLVKRLKGLHEENCVEIPPAASNLIYELYRSKSGYKIRILYNSTPIQCSNNPDEEYCKLGDFRVFCIL